MPEQLYRDRRERRKEPSRTCCWRERSSPDTCSTHTGDTISDTKRINYIGHIRNQDINCNFYIYYIQRQQNILNTILSLDHVFRFI